MIDYVNATKPVKSLAASEPSDIVKAMIAMPFAVTLLVVLPCLFVWGFNHAS